MLWDGTNASPAVVSGAERLAQSGGVPYIRRSPEEFASCFDGLTMAPPGLVPQWRPEDPDAVGMIDAHGAVAREP
ncbi:SAM-dependent methyltransferase [Micromonospora sp. NPDC048935]|uniref:SAM-dependent methyltransferase n=1 Tax=Micromonospora sp. NPDC048935 TaxID=3364262 RepID=UPI003711DD94